jgi:hypothetical protein
MTSYSLGRWYRAFVFFSTAWFGVGIVLVIWNLLTTSESIPRRAFFMLWIVLVAFGLRWYLFEYAYDLHFDDEWLYWKSPLRSGRASLHELRLVQARWGTDGFIESSDGRRIRVLVQKGFTRFGSRLADRCPWIQVRIGWVTRFLEWFPGSTMFRG